MEDKTFELLEKMYSEFVQFKNEVNGKFDEVNGKFDEVNGKFDEVNGKFDEVNGRFDEVNGRFDEVNGRLDEVRGHIVRVENDHGKKLDVLLDGYKQNSEDISEINYKLDRLTDRVENQEIKLQVLKSVK